MFIGFKAKDGTVLKFGYGYENEIVPEFKIPDDLADLLKVKKNRAEVISACFDDCGDSLMETMEAFSVPEWIFRSIRPALTINLTTLNDKFDH